MRCRFVMSGTCCEERITDWQMHIVLVVLLLWWVMGGGLECNYVHVINMTSTASCDWKCRPDAGSYEYWQQRAQTYDEACQCHTVGSKR